MHGDPNEPENGFRERLTFVIRFVGLKSDRFKTFLLWGPIHGQIPIFIRGFIFGCLELLLGFWNCCWVSVLLLGWARQNVCVDIFGTVLIV